MHSLPCRRISILVCENQMPFMSGWQFPAEEWERLLQLMSRRKSRHSDQRDLRVFRLPNSLHPRTLLYDPKPNHVS